MNENIRYIFLELGRFWKRLWELEEAYDKWMYLLCHLQDMTERSAIFEEIEFERLFNLARISNFTPEEYKAYQQSLNYMCDYLNTIDYAASEALEKGRKEGRLDAVRRMIAAGLSLEQVATIMDISIDEIQELK